MICADLNNGQVITSMPYKTIKSVGPALVYLSSTGACAHSSSSSFISGTLSEYHPACARTYRLAFMRTSFEVISMRKRDYHMCGKVIRLKLVSP